MKIILYISLVTHLLFAEETKIYFYSTDININNFKSLKISCNEYIRDYGSYQFQPFSDKETFEKQLRVDNSILIISSWHYQKLAKKYNLEALLVAQKKGTITDSKILVGKKNSQMQGFVTSAYDIAYSDELLLQFTKKQNKKMPVLIVPKEIDALMSISFGMSSFALVSKDSLNFLKKINPSLTKDFQVFYESEPKYRILLANNILNQNKQEVITMFTNISKTLKGKKFLEMIDIEKFTKISKKDRTKLGDLKWK